MVVNNVLRAFHILILYSRAFYYWFVLIILRKAQITFLIKKVLYLAMVKNVLTFIRSVHADNRSKDQLQLNRFCGLLSYSFSFNTVYDFCPLGSFLFSKLFTFSQSHDYGPCEIQILSTNYYLCTL